MQKQPKTDRIKGFVAAGLDNKTIAHRVGCRVDYVRAIKHRMRNPDYDKRWIDAMPGRREAHNRRQRAYRHRKRLEAVPRQTA